MACSKKGAFRTLLQMSGLQIRSGGKVFGESRSRTGRSGWNGPVAPQKVSVLSVQTQELQLLNFSKRMNITVSVYVSIKGFWLQLLGAGNYQYSAKSQKSDVSPRIGDNFGLWMPKSLTMSNPNHCDLSCDFYPLFQRFGGDFGCDFAGALRSQIAAIWNRHDTVVAKNHYPRKIIYFEWSRRRVIYYAAIFYPE